MHVNAIRGEALLMLYGDQLQKLAGTNEKRSFLVSGEPEVVTVRLPKNLHEAAKEAASLCGTSFSAYVRYSINN